MDGPKCKRLIFPEFEHIILTWLYPYIENELIKK